MEQCREMKNKKFMFFENFLEAIGQLPEEERAVACYEFCKYGISGELPKNKYLAMFCLGVSASVQKYQGSGGKREGAGAPIGNKNAKKQVDNTINQINQNNQNNQIEKINQIQQTETETETKNRNNKEIYKESFEEFWKLFPKQRAGSKEKAYSSYCRAIKEKRVTQEKLLEAVKNYSQSKFVKDGFAKGCAAWLNDDRFNDEYKTSSSVFDDPVVEHNLDWI